jgi:hypothetical protein
VQLPFSRAQFLEVFSTYNAAIWPSQVVAAVMGLAVIALLVTDAARAHQLIAGVLSAFWAFMSVGYHFIYFSEINATALAFGIGFMIASVVFLVEGVVRARIRFSWTAGPRGWIAGVLMIYSLVVYPLLGLLVWTPYPETPLFGVAPCPTTIFTIGLLILARYRSPLLLAAIPLIWSGIGGSAAFLLDIPQDLGLPAAGVSWVVVRMALPAESSVR